jgi:hypothetical protein
VGTSDVDACQRSTCDSAASVLFVVANAVLVQLLQVL